MDFFNVHGIHTDEARTDHIDDADNAVDGLTGDKGHGGGFSVAVNSFIGGNLQKKIL